MADANTMHGTLQQFLAAHLHARLSEADIRDAENLLLFGAGQHTWWLLATVPEALTLPVRAVIDTDKVGWCGPWPVITPEDAAKRYPNATIVLSTDCHQAVMSETLRQTFTCTAGHAPTLINLYTGLPPGPYGKADAGQPHPGHEAMVRGSALWLSRTIQRLAPHLQTPAPKPVKVLLLGQSWQVAAAAEPLRLAGIATTTSAADATHAVTLDDAFDANRPAVFAFTGRDAAKFTGQTPSLRNGERPWVDRRITSHTTLSDKPLRIVLRHDQYLGDVVLSQGILPERIKTELYPRSHITFVTARTNWRRPEADDTGWCVDICRHNPFIDKIVATDQATEELYAHADLHYTINGSGALYQHVCDFHAQHVELPPGRTDATIHLSDDDRSLSSEVIEPFTRSGGPCIGVNMGLTLERFRGWGHNKTLELCARIERELGGTVVWFGWTDCGPYTRLMRHSKPLSARQQAAVMARCDVHISNQGGGANMSAAVGCPTLALSGLHPCWREGVAYLNNHAIDNPAKHHVEIWRSGDELVTNGLGGTRRVPWSIVPPEHGRENVELITRHEHELWGCITPVSELPRSEPWWWRTRDVTVDDVVRTLIAMLDRGFGFRRVEAPSTTCDSIALT